MNSLSRYLATAILLLTSAAVPVSAQINVQITKSGPASEQSGVPFEYTLQYTCASLTADCENVVVTDTLPAGLELVGCVSSGDVVTETCALPTVSFDFATLGAGRTGDLKITAQFPAGSTPNGTMVTNTATIDSSNAGTQVSNPVTTTATASIQLTFDKRRIGGSAVDQNTVYEIEACQPRGTHRGGLNATAVSVVDTLPPEAVFVSATPAAIYDGMADTVTWMLPDLNVIDFSVPDNCVLLELVVNYPGPAPPLPPMVTNTAEITYTPVGESPEMMSDDITNVFDPPSPGVAFVKSANATIYRIDFAGNPPTVPALEYELDLGNVGNVLLRNVVLEEDPITTDLEVTSISLATYSPAVPVTLGIRVDGGAYVDFPGFTGSDTAANLITMAGGGSFITAVRWDFGDLPVGFRLLSGITGFQAKIRPSVTPGSTVTNTVTMTSDDLPTQVSPADVIAVADIFPRVTKTNSATSAFPSGEAVQFTLTVSNGVTSSNPLSNFVVLDVMTEKILFEGFSINYNGLTPPALPPVFSTRTLSNNSTLLRWNFDGFSMMAGESIIITVDARFAVGVSGNQNNIAYVTAENGGPVLSDNCVGTGADTNDDFDSDGVLGAADILCKSEQRNFNIAEIASLASSKEVRGICSPSFGTSARTSPNGFIEWRLAIENTGNVAANQLVIYDILPFPGDTGVVSFTEARDSRWRPILLEPVTAPAGVTVEYSLSGNPCRPEMNSEPPGNAWPPGCVDDWATALPINITTVQAIRFSLGDQAINPGDELVFSWPMRAPVSAPVGPTETAFNSIGISAVRVDNSDPFLPAEPNKVGITTFDCDPQPAFHGDFIWSDSNGNGQQDPGEPGINGVRLELFEIGPDGLPETADDVFVEHTVTTTDGASDGFFRLDFVAPGDYFLKCFPPPNHLVSPQDTGTDDTIDSDADAGCVVETTLALGETDLTCDIGLIDDTATAALGNFVWADRNADGLQNESLLSGINGVTVELLDVAMTPVATTTTADDVFGNPGFYLFSAVTPGAYRIRVTLPAGATGFTTQGPTNLADPADSDVNAAGESDFFTLAAAQTDLSRDAGVIFPTGPLSLGDRVWLDPEGDGLYDPMVADLGIDNVRVELLDPSGNVLATTTTFTRSLEAGFYEFVDLPPGDYVVRLPAFNFPSGEALGGLLPSPGNDPAPDPDDDVDDDDNGVPVGGGLESLPVTLAAGTEPGGDDNPSVDFALVQGPSIAVTKSASPLTVPAAGANVTFSQTVENDGPTTVTITTMTATIGGAAQDLAAACGLPRVIAPMGQFSCDVTRFISGNADDTVTCLVEASGQDTNGFPVSDTASSVVTVVAPRITATKADALFVDSGLPGFVDPGDTVRYTVVITNTGTADADGVTFAAPAVANAALVVGSVTAPGATVTSGNTPGDTTVGLTIGTLAPSASTTILYEVVVDDPLASGVTQIDCQGTVTGSNIPTTPTDDPDTPTPDDPTVTPLTSGPLASATKTDTLLIDVDMNGVADPGDVVRYTVVIANPGNAAADMVTFSAPPVVNASLVVDSVTAPGATVTSGLTPGDTTVGVDIGTLAGAGASVTILYEVLIDDPLPAGVTQIDCQGTVTGSNIPTTPTDDPDTPTPDDPTVTPVNPATVPPVGIPTLGTWGLMAFVLALAILALPLMRMARQRTPTIAPLL